MKIRDFIDVDNIDFTDMQLFKNYIEWDNLMYDIEKLEERIEKINKLLKKPNIKKYNEHNQYIDLKHQEYINNDYSYVEGNTYNDFYEKPNKAA